VITQYATHEALSRALDPEPIPETRVRMLGPVQARLVGRAGTSTAGNVMPANYLERRALRRMQARGIAATVPGLPDVWSVNP
jgi:hypothetical protein